ncbi:hypothetical protein CC85DRAFT_302071 [Cutaneotrichosporon oleaginosum]|uniref:Uncharacterized protein n=1 Tax=Cutaneotrichosporon oleaginosum TaxID=879819 RepID=A0A0J0XNT2_9TREE|nr:uncharacterized protein CC85DRAFT_302071 [Cutaneotrichosporon oleaginosum]KLT42747.1 hypothetical protein CC85DRAFT_302071 [Cutaneotrichosporon oleaginosum]TXT09534.1 hypothetical protein COLE_03468 [Cutaneotrichosporon oleaginosum]
MSSPFLPASLSEDSSHFDYPAPWDEARQDADAEEAERTKRAELFAKQHLEITDRVLQAHLTVQRTEEIIDLVYETFHHNVLSGLDLALPLETRIWRARGAANAMLRELLPSCPAVVVDRGPSKPRSSPYCRPQPATAARHSDKSGSLLRQSQTPSLPSSFSSVSDLSPPASDVNDPAPNQSPSRAPSSPARTPSPDWTSSEFQRRLKALPDPAFCTAAPMQSAVPPSPLPQESPVELLTTHPKPWYTRQTVAWDHREKPEDITTRNSSNKLTKTRYDWCRTLYLPNILDAPVPYLPSVAGAHYAQLFRGWRGNPSNPQHPKEEPGSKAYDLYAYNILERALPLRDQKMHGSHGSFLDAVNEFLIHNSCQSWLLRRMGLNTLVERERAYWSSASMAAGLLEVVVYHLHCLLEAHALTTFLSLALLPLVPSVLEAVSSSPDAPRFGSPQRNMALDFLDNPPAWGASYRGPSSSSPARLQSPTALLHALSSRNECCFVVTERSLHGSWEASLELTDSVGSLTIGWGWAKERATARAAAERSAISYLSEAGRTARSVMGVHRSRIKVTGDRYKALVPEITTCESGLIIATIVFNGYSGVGAGHNEEEAEDMASFCLARRNHIDIGLSATVGATVYF